MPIITLRTETGQFVARFNANVQRLFLSNFFQTISSPLVSIFIGAFIWRATDSLLAVALYSLGQFALQPLVFGLNGILLSRIPVQKAFSFGAIIYGITGIAVVFLGGIHTPFIFLLCGFLKACGDGLYWPNRNYLELQEVTDGTRNYYFGLIHSVFWLANIFVPLIAGWFIVFGKYTNWYSEKIAYWMVFGVSFILMLAAAYTILGGKYESPKLKHITRFNLQKFFNERRLLNIAQGIVDGTTFIVPLIILIYLGNEGILGTISALAAIMASVMLYLYGRFAGAARRYQLALISSIAFVCCGLALILLPHPLNALFFALFANIASDFFITGIDPILLAHSDREMNGDAGLRYTFIFDNELYLNLGRVCGVLIIIAFTIIGSQQVGLLYSALSVGLIQFALIGGVQLYRRRNTQNL